MKNSDPRHPCNTFLFLNETARSTKNVLDVDYDQQILCDRTLRRHWYRFGTGSGRLPESCPSELSCGTHSPIYLDASGVGEEAIWIFELSFYKMVEEKTCLSLFDSPVRLSSSKHKSIFGEHDECDEYNRLLDNWWVKADSGQRLLVPNCIPYSTSHSLLPHFIILIISVELTKVVACELSFSSQQFALPLRWAGLLILRK